MTPAELSAAVADLQKSLGDLVDQDALPELTIPSPTHDDNEASFLRLVAWSYVLLFEVGRITIPFLLGLPSGASRSEERTTREVHRLVHALRTWCFHNLDLNSARDRATRQRVNDWLEETCTAHPRDDADWQKCCQKLHSHLGHIVSHCQDVTKTVLSSPDDGPDIIADLQRRIKTAWPAHEFDKIVGDAAIRLGIPIDPRKFREPRLQTWRDFLESLPESENLLMSVTRLIEGDLLEYAGNWLPVGGEDVMNALGIDPGPEVGVALRKARELFQAGIRNRAQLLQRLQELQE